MTSSTGKKQLCFRAWSLAFAPFWLVLNGGALAQGAPGSLPAPRPAAAQPYKIIAPAVQPVLSPGVVLLMELEGRFAQSVALGGGKAFASWFADDAVTLNNGKPAQIGRAAIAAEATWDAKAYSLTWTPEGAQMGPSNDMGFTWGHYEGRVPGASSGNSGRYFTVWKKTADGTWKVALDASANEPPVERLP